MINNLLLVKDFIIDQFLFGDDEGFKKETSFLKNGLIDSMGIMELVAFLEKSFDIKIEDNELLPQNLDSLEKIEKFIESKRNNESL